MKLAQRFAIAVVVCLVLHTLTGCATAPVEEAYEEDPPPGIEAPPGMVYVPPGEVMVRILESRYWCIPPHHKTELARGFFIDRYEFPNVAGAAPLGGVSFVEAQGECVSAGKRLCTMLEWLKACQGPGMTQYAYGSSFKEGCCNTSGPGFGRSSEHIPPALEASGARPCCRSGYGAYDMNGNLWEWTSEPLETMYGTLEEIGQRYLMGGSYTVLGHRCSCENKEASRRDYSTETYGFRCCMDAE